MTLYREVMQFYVDDFDRRTVSDIISRLYFFCEAFAVDPATTIFDIKYEAENDSIFLKTPLTDKELLDLKQESAKQQANLDQAVKDAERK
jgi:hypothetical protein